MKHQARNDLRRRLERLAWATGENRGLQDIPWLTSPKLVQLRDLLEDGVPIEAPTCQRLLTVAWTRRARGEPEEGKPKRMTEAELEERAERVNAAIDERRGRGRLIARDDGNFSWVPVESRHF